MARLRRSGNVTLLRAHERGTGFGPGNDHIDVEAVGQISSEPQHFFGLRLRTDATLPSREAMFALLRDAVVHHDDLRTTVEYDVDTDNDKRNGILIRVELRPR
jgi:hypothetical protein